MDEDGLRRTFADAHRRYTGFINARHRWTGHLWQGRFGAVVMDEAHLAHAMRYVSLNPVRARLVDRAEDWRWSSVPAHPGTDDAFARVAPAIERYGDFAAFLGSPTDYAYAWHALRRSEPTGSPPSRPSPAARLHRKSADRSKKLIYLVNCHRNYYDVNINRGQPVQVNRRAYDTSESSSTYTIPDSRVGRIAIDVTLTRKTYTGTPQMRGFFNSDFKPTATVIIRPSQLGKGSTYVIKAPR